MTNTSLKQFNTITFDVVGTLIDFEKGILDWFRPVLASKDAPKSDNDILTAFARHEDVFQQSHPNEPFTAMLSMIYLSMMQEWELPATTDEAESFRNSIQHWPAFPDTVAALKVLKQHFRIVAVTNADMWALNYMSATLSEPFDLKITCDLVGVNKPSLDVFEFVLTQLAPEKVTRDQILHAAQSQYHDIAPATAFGLATMWIERRHGQEGFGATPLPDSVITPNFHAVSMADFAAQFSTELG